MCDATHVLSLSEKCRQGEQGPGCLVLAVQGGCIICTLKGAPLTVSCPLPPRLDCGIRSFMGWLCCIIKIGLGEAIRSTFTSEFGEEGRKEERKGKLCLIINTLQLTENL